MRKVCLAKINNLPKPHSAGPPKHGAQCSCIGCIGWRPALRVWHILHGLFLQLVWDYTRLQPMDSTLRLHFQKLEC